MNCQEFKSLMPDLARERLMEATARESALAHADACVRCAAQLADARTLTVGLHAFAAASAETENAPARVEAALLAAFRARGVNASPAASLVQMHPAPAVGTPHRWMRRAVATAATAAAAAALLVTFGVVAPRWQTDAPSPQQASNQQQAGKQLEKPQAASPVAPASAVAILVEPPGSNDNASTPPTAGLTVAKNTMRHSVGRRVAARSRTSAVVRAERGSGVAPENESAASGRAPVAASNGASNGAAAATNDGEVEIATEFMPLVPGGTSTSTEGAQLVRVELPRSALASMGLPLNVESSSERVKADVLLGEDGMARAIRFVR